MAKFTTDGLEDLMGKMRRMEAGLRGECLRSILNAGGTIIRDSWKGKIQEYHHVRTGAMLENVGITDMTVNGGTAYVEIYPFGTDSHRITNAQKAYILDRGRRPNKNGRGAIQGDKFVRAAEREAKNKAFEAMQQALNEYVARNGG